MRRSMTPASFGLSPFVGLTLFMIIIIIMDMFMIIQITTIRIINEIDIIADGGVDLVQHAGEPDAQRPVRDVVVVGLPLVEVAVVADRDTEGHDLRHPAPGPGVVLVLC